MEKVGESGVMFLRDEVYEEGNRSRGRKPAEGCGQNLQIIGEGEPRMRGPK